MKLLSRRWGRSRLFLTVLLVFSTVPLWGQAIHDATLTGTISLQAGEKLPGVTVTVTSPELVSRERQVMSDGEGKFIFLGLPPGKYVFSATLQGFKTYKATGITLRAGDNKNLSVVLQPGAYEESIVVTGAAPLIDTKSATISTTFTDEMLQKLPTARNPFYDLAVTTPGIASVGSNESWLSSPSAYGSAANENIFLVNGVNTTNPRGAPWGSLVNVNYNTVEEVKVLALGSKAEYGSFSGAAIDVMTKSGSNEIKGDVAWFSQLGNAANNATLNFGGSTQFGEKKLYADPNDILTSKPKSNWEGSATVGGPILKDRLWFYGGYGRYGVETDTPLWQPLDTYKASIFDAKLTGDFTASQRAWVAYHYEDTANGNQTWGQTWDPSLSYEQTAKNHTGQAQYQWMANDRNLLSFKYLGFQTNQAPKLEQDMGHPGYINWWKWIGTQSIGVNGDFPNIELQKSNRHTLQLDHTHYASDFYGTHELKYGLQYTKAEGNWVGGYFHNYANFAYPYPWDYGPATNWWWNCDADWCWGSKANPVFPMYNMKTQRDPWLTVRQSNSQGAFIDDTWSLNSRLTLNLGLRYDNMTAKYGEGAMYQPLTRPSDILNPKVARTRAGSGNIFDFNTWSPRLGFAYVLTDDNKTVLSGHVGRYFAPLSVETLRRFGPDMDKYQVDTYRYDLPMSLVDLNKNGLIDPNEVVFATRQLAGRTPNATMSTGLKTSPSALEVVAGTKSPYTDQLELSLQRQIGTDFAIEGTYVYKHTDNLIAYRPYNTATGQYWEWESVPFKAWTGYQTQVWQIPLKDYDGNGKTDVEDAKFVKNHTDFRATNANNFAPGGKADRLFQGLQLVVNKRQSNRWAGQFSINYAISDGLAGRTVSQDWYIDGPMIMDTPFGYSMNQFQNNQDGPLPMTPKWMLKAAGLYTIPKIETDFGLRWRFDTGRPFWPVQDIPQFATWMSDLQPGVYLGTANDTIVASDPTNPDYMPSTSIFDLNLAKQLTFGQYGARIELDVLNAFNTNSPNRIGWRQADYGRVYSIVQPRVYRAGVKFIF